MSVRLFFFSVLLPSVLWPAVVWADDAINSAEPALKIGSTFEGSSVKPQATNTLDRTPALRGAIIDTLSNSNSLKSAAVQAKAAQYDSQAALRDLLPSINLSLEKGYRKGLSSGFPVLSNVDTASLNATWTVFAGGSKIANAIAADLNAKSSRLNYLVQERNEALKVASAYLQILADRKFVVVLLESRSHLLRIRRNSQLEFNAGLASQTDVLLVTSQISDVDLQIIDANKDLQTQTLALSALTGKAAPDITHLPAIENLIPNDLPATLRRAMNGNLTVAVTEYAAQSLSAQADASRGKLSPIVSIIGQAQTDLDNLVDSSKPAVNQNWYIGVKLDVPLTNFAAYSQLDAARARASAARYHMLDSKTQIEKEVATNWHELMSMRQKSVVFDQKIAANRIVTSGVAKEVKAGLRSVSDLLRAESNLASTEFEQIRNEVNRAALAYRIAVHFTDLPTEMLGG